ncbi:MAG: DUF3142 domain-containing protein [Armatimonadetes bacterium]|nr:DUF3142 domain-containing protein [Armatimonadota bacterium]
MVEGRRTRWIAYGAAFAVLLAAVGILLVRRPWRKPPPFQVSYWYWQTPFTLDAKLAGQLREMGVRQLFVRAGTWSTDGKNIVLVAPQQYGKGCDAFPVHLVFNADSGVTRHFEDLDNAKVARQIADRIVARVDQARKAGVLVVGVQLDIDCPTRLLPKYADIVSRIRRDDPLLARKGGLQFSVTGLTSWLGSAGVTSLGRQLDFMVPQAYEGVTGRTVDDVRPVFDPDTLRRGLWQAESLPCPYWFGVPAYGHAFLFDDKGQLVSTYRGLEAQDALRHPKFQLEAAYPASRTGKRVELEKDWVGEELAEFRAVQPAADGRGLGYRLVYTLPSPELVARGLETVLHDRGPGCQGAVVYRVPEAGSSFTVPMESVLSRPKGRVPQVRVEAKLRSESDTLGAMEATEPGLPADVWIELTNTGDSATFVAPDAFVIDLQFDKPGFGDVRLRDFDAVQFLRDGVETSPARADKLRLSKGWFYPGETLKVGPIRLLDSVPFHAKIAWRARLPSGLKTTQGTLPEASVGGS